MASFYKEGNKINFQGFRGKITKITETYRKNVIIVNITDVPPSNRKDSHKIVQIGLFEYPDGHLEFMNKIYDND